MNNKRMKVGLVSLPVTKAGIPPLENIVNILKNLFNRVYVIVGKSENFFVDFENVEYINSGMKIVVGQNIFFRSVNYVCNQFFLALDVACHSKKVNGWIFFGGGGLIIPLITAKILKKKTILSVTVSVDQSNAQRKGIEKFFLKMIVFSIKTNFFIADKIFLSDKNLLQQWDLPSDSDKICIAYEHYIDYQKFHSSMSHPFRSNLVGFVGRLSHEKGIKNFARSMNLLKNSGIQFSVAGEGELYPWLQKFIKEHYLGDIVHFEGWIAHENLTDHLNKLKLLVIPSYTESGPLIALEAIACGTPILATKVGKIPGIIFHDETGFLLDNNSPECIAQGITHALEFEDTESIITNSLNLIQQKYTFEKVVENYRNNLIKVIYD